MGNPKRRKQKKAILGAAKAAPAPLTKKPTPEPVAETPAPEPVKKSLVDAIKEVATKPAIKKDKN